MYDKYEGWVSVGGKLSHVSLIVKNAAICLQTEQCGSVTAVGGVAQVQVRRPKFRKIVLGLVWGAGSGGWWPRNTDCCMSLQGQSDTQK